MIIIYCDTSLEIFNSTVEDPKTSTRACHLRCFSSCSESSSFILHIDAQLVTILILTSADVVNQIIYQYQRFIWPSLLAPHSVLPASFPSSHFDKAVSCLA